MSQIATKLPVSEDAFLVGSAQDGPFLENGLLGGPRMAVLPSCAIEAIIASVIARILNHICRSSPNDREYDINGEFWKRHRSLDQTNLNLALSLPANIRLPHALNDQLAIFDNMMLHTATITLHQAAILKAGRLPSPNRVFNESRSRCLVAAEQITCIMKMISHTDLTRVSP